jgi:hypothetical protein
VGSSHELMQYSVMKQMVPNLKLILTLTPLTLLMLMLLTLLILLTQQVAPSPTTQ